jgi:hypothetical protein
MKLHRLTAVCAAAAGIALVAPQGAQAQSQTPALPVGWLSASPGIVRAGTRPELKWSITHPASVIDYVTVTNNTVTPKEELDMEIRVLGAGVTSSNSNGTNFTFVPTEAAFSYDGGSYSRIFYGTNHDVVPSKIVKSGVVQKGKPLRFGGRYFWSNKWSAMYTSTSGTMNVRTLVNGQTPPTTYPLHTAPTLENFIKPYLDAGGRVKIGPMDVIVFMELTHTDAQKSNQGYDLQDMVLLVTFRTRN